MDAKPKPYTVGRLPGGQYPEVGALLTESFAEFGDHFGPYALAGLGQMIVVFPLVLFAMFAMYLFMIVGIVGVSALAAGLIVVAERTVGQDAATLLAIPVQLVSILVFLLGFLVFGAGLGALVAPLNASLVRAVAAHQRGEGTLDLSSSFSTATEGMLSSVTVGGILGALTLFGVLFCYLPALLVPILFTFASSLVALHQLGGVRATMLSLRWALANPGWALPFGLGYTMLLMISGNVPVVGPMFVTALHVRAHRYVFGDGAEPVLSAAGSSSGERNTQ